MASGARLPQLVETQPDAAALGVSTAWVHQLGPDVPRLVCRRQHDVEVIRTGIA